MMMPANFSAIAENELVYVVGGSAVTDWAKTFNTNLVTIVGNSYVEKLTKATLSIMFGGAWGDKTFADGFKAAYGTGFNGFNKFMQVVGTGAAIYQLGTTATGSLVENPGKTSWTVYNKKGEVVDSKDDDSNMFTTLGRIPTTLYTKYFA